MKSVISFNIIFYLCVLNVIYRNRSISPIVMYKFSRWVCGSILRKNLTNSNKLNPSLRYFENNSTIYIWCFSIIESMASVEYFSISIFPISSLRLIILFTKLRFNSFLSKELDEFVNIFIFYEPLLGKMECI